MVLNFFEYVNQLVHASVSFHSSASFMFLGVYVKCARVGRWSVWVAIESLGTNMHLPWMDVGDFNVILSVGERASGSPTSVHNMEEFKSMFNCGLSIVEFIGQSFIWTNSTIWQRLDRALINARWMEFYLINKVFHLVRERSCHSPLFMHCGSGRQLHSSFRSLNVWCNHPKFWMLW